MSGRTTCPRAPQHAARMVVVAAYRRPQRAAFHPRRRTSGASQPSELSGRAAGRRLGCNPRLRSHLRRDHGEHLGLVDHRNTSQAPYINPLASKYAYSTSYFGITHPSLPNYLTLTGGSSFGITSDCLPSSCPVNAVNIADRLEGAGAV